MKNHNKLTLNKTNAFVVKMKAFLGHLSYLFRYNLNPSLVNFQDKRKNKQFLLTFQMDKGD